MGLFSKNKERKGYTSIKDFLVLKYYSSLYSDGLILEEITLMRHGICRFRIDSEKENILVSYS
ncbi:hypothetical protein [uncultured Clostridium sp.]|uniref:hypothetical protein n=1 Tax=uncultured Clostridium sp. TaxID=59620 RepID=UPI00259B489D|nr:hypothetical protein [uncultured Clostridium sp.]